MSTLPPNTAVPKPQYIMYAMASVGCLGLGFVLFRYYPGTTCYILFVIALVQAVMAVKLYRKHISGMSLTRHGQDVECRFTAEPDCTYYLAVGGIWAVEDASSPVMLRNVPEGALISLAVKGKSDVTLVSEGKA